MNLPLLEVAERAPMAEASLEAFAHVCETLNQREIAVMLALHSYLAQTAFPNSTGGELAAFMGLDRTSVRPRLTMLAEKGYVTKTAATRESRHPTELRCHGYAPAVPRAAIERLRNQQKTA